MSNEFEAGLKSFIKGEEDRLSKLKTLEAILQKKFARFLKIEEDLARLKSSQGDVVISLDVGGRVFKTTLSTLRCEIPNDNDHYFQSMALLRANKPQRKQKAGASPSKKKKSVAKTGHSEKTSFFIDRDPTYFRYLLNYLREKGDVTKVIFPTDKLAVEEIIMESEFYKLYHLSNLLKEKVRPKEVLILHGNTGDYLTKVLSPHFKVTKRRVDDPASLNDLEKYGIVTFELMDGHFTDVYLASQMKLLAWAEKGGKILWTHDTIDHKQVHGKGFVDVKFFRMCGMDLKKDKSSHGGHCQTAVVVDAHHAIFSSHFKLEVKENDQIQVANTHDTFAVRKDGIEVMKMSNGNRFLYLKGKHVYTAIGHTPSALSEFEKKLLVNIVKWMM